MPVLLFGILKTGYLTVNEKVNTWNFQNTIKNQHIDATITF